MANRSAEQLRVVTERIFTAAGAPPDIAAEMGEALVGANLAGHDSHGVIRIPAYLRMIASGQLDPKARPEVIKETATTALVDGKWTFGHVAAKFGTDVAVKKAKASTAQMTEPPRRPSPLYLSPGVNAPHSISTNIARA